MKSHPTIQRAVDDLCARFEAHDYNPMPIVDLGALVANADGNVDDNEIEALRQMLESLLGAQFNAELTQYLIKASLEIIEAAGVEPRVRLLAEILLDCDAVEEGIIVALGVAYASEGLSDSERRVIAKVAQAAELSESRLDELCKEVGESFESA